MAKKAKLSFTAPTMATQTDESKKRDEEYQLRDDADKIKRYAELRQDKGRHGKAIQHIRKENDQINSISGDYDDAEDRTEQPRILARSGRKRATRRLGRA